MVCSHKWSPISYRLSVGQEKFTGRRPAFYHCATQPTIGRTATLFVFFSLEYRNKTTYTRDALCRVIYLHFVRRTGVIIFTVAVYRVAQKNYVFSTHQIVPIDPPFTARHLGACSIGSVWRWSADEYICNVIQVIHTAASLTFIALLNSVEANKYTQSVCQLHVDWPIHSHAACVTTKPTFSTALHRRWGGVSASVHCVHNLTKDYRVCMPGFVLWPVYCVSQVAQ